MTQYPNQVHYLATDITRPCPDQAVRSVQFLCCDQVVVAVMKIGNIMSGVGIEPAFLAFHTSVLTITQAMDPKVNTISISTCLCGFSA